MRSSRFAVLATLPVLALGPGVSLDPLARVAPLPARAEDETGTPASFPDLGLSFDLGRFGELKRRDISNPTMPVMWTGELDGSKVELALILFPGETFGYQEPIPFRLEIQEGMARRAREGDVPFRFTETWLHAGEYGYATYASAGRGPFWEKGQEVGEVWCLAGLLSDSGYTLRATFEPAPSKELAAETRRLFEEGVTYEGDVRDPNWTDEEAEARWRQDVPVDLADELDLVMRTDHYIVMSNKRKADLFGRKMEEFYKEIDQIFPFDDVEGQRLMPVYVFQDRDEFVEFTMERFEMSREEANRAAGFASGDLYFTTYGSPNDPVHIHEATHQVFGNRLFLGGGGSWFQEGVAEYVGTSENERNVVANSVKKGRHVPLRDFVQLPSLLYSSEKDRKTGGSAGGDAYKQAALFIEFLRDSKWAKKEHKDKFPEWLQVMGNTPRGDVAAIEAVFKRLYGMDLDELDAEFQNYCKKR